MQAVGGGGGGRLEFAAAVAPLAHVGGAALALGLAKRARDAACAAHAQDERGDGDGAPQNCSLPVLIQPATAPCLARDFAANNGFANSRLPTPPAQVPCQRRPRAALRGFSTPT